MDVGFGGLFVGGSGGFWQNYGSGVFEVGYVVCVLMRSLKMVLVGSA